MNLTTNKEGQDLVGIVYRLTIVNDVWQLLSRIVHKKKNKKTVAKKRSVTVDQGQVGRSK